MARTTINSLGVPAGTITATDLSYPLTDFSSTGIDDNATSTAITIDSSENTTFAGTITSGDITVSDGTPFIRLQDSDVTNGYTQISNVNGNGYIGARNDSADGSLLIGGYGGGTFTEFARWSDAGHLTQKYNLTVQGSFTSLGIDDNASSTVMTIASSGETTFTGDIVISEATPAITLDDADNADGELKIVQSTGSSFYRTRGVSGNGAHVFQRNNGTTNLKIFQTNTSGDVIFYENDGATSGLTWDASASKLTNFTSTGIDDNATSTAITIDASENVGIGTTSPNALLHVSSSGNGEIEVERVGGALINLQAQSAVGVIGTDSNHDLRFKTNGSVRASITSAGNVGIGTTSPTHDLTVGSTSAADYVIALRGGVGGFLGWDDSANTTILQAPNTRSLSFRVNSDTFSAGTEAMRISSDGTVGIGVTNPTGATLEIQSNAGANALKFRARTNDDYSFIQFYDNAGTTLRGQIANHNGDFNFYTGSSGTIRAKLNTSGHLAIGNTNATYILDVDAGAPASSDQVLGRFSSQNGIRDIGFVWDDSASTLGIATLTNHALTFHTNGNSSERMRIDGSGNVLIGRTSTPSGIQAGSLCINFDIHHQDAAGNDRLLYDRSANLFGNTGTNGAFYSVGIGTTSPTSNCKLHLVDADVQIELEGTGGSNSGFINFDGSSLQLSTNRNMKTGAFSNTGKSNATMMMRGVSGGSEFRFYTASANNTTASERMRIGSSGDVIISGTAMLASALLTVDGNGNVRNGVCARVNNNAYWNYVGINSSGSNSFYVYGDGDVENTNNSYGAISDERVKSNIVDASSQIDDIMAVQVRSYTLNETGDTHIGVVAQELEASGMSGLVKTNDDGMKSVKYSILYMKTIKALQEAVTRIETLEAEVAVLKGA